MGWKGSLIGSFLGSFVARSWLGALLGAVVGHQVEERYFGPKRKGGRASPYASLSERDRSMMFCATVAAILAKIAKADGHVTQGEINRIEGAFRQLGFSPSARSYAVRVFRRAKDDARSIYQYAGDFADLVDSVEMRELLYEILWDVAGADGEVGPNEQAMLRRLPMALRIRPDWFAYFASSRLGGNRGGAPNRSSGGVEAAYAILGASAGDSDDELKRKYRELAKKNHPDALRAQGLPEAMVGKATERMSRINAAWAEIKEARGL